ncbi:MAG: alanine--tRNA ligase [Eubacteriales bacterium]
MKQPTPFGLNELRELFLSFFESKGHLRLPSFSLVPKDDASLLLINSGMAPMKPWFTGEAVPPRTRVTTCQKCIRTGDIENIGKTARHGTYFEMLGNFSFGDYFKTEAIAWCWEFLTDDKWVGLDPDLLYPSIYVDDEEAFEIWNKTMNIPAERIFRFGKADNFWEHGSGPCGPCSEVYYDRGEQYGCGSPTCTVGCECDRYIEVWNNVFTQFDSDGHDNYAELAQKNIDTGMGLERLACVCQGVFSLFDVDTVRKITAKVTELTGASYGTSAATDVSLRVITDHIRSATMMISDGVLPSNEGRGYVLRRLLRRAARHGKLLGVNHPFLFEVCETVISENKVAYPDLVEREGYITKIIRVEEENFAKTIDSGMKIFDEMMSSHKASKATVFSGEDAFKLYDTYGFPIDLTLEMVEESGLTVDVEQFKSLMEEQRNRARKAREALGDLGWAGIEFGKEMPATTFTGYDHTSTETKILALVSEGELRDELITGNDGIMVLEHSPFYAEMGGQLGDHGTISSKNGIFTVTDVQSNKGGKYMHYGRVTEGSFSVNDGVTATIDTKHRLAISRAHSATHLLHKALQEVLGEHVHQAGSLVDTDSLRFDFTHFSAMTPQEIAEVENLVNHAVLEGHPIVTKEMTIEEAKQSGATALFGEKYGDRVRVVNMNQYSVELCGGTHLTNSAQVGLFRITSEFSVAAGVRRIEAITGLASLTQTKEDQALILEISSNLKTNPADLKEKVNSTIHEMKVLIQMVERFKAKEAAGEADRFLISAHPVGDLKVMTTMAQEGDGNTLRQMGDLLRDKHPNIVAVLSVVNDGKITLLATCGKEAIAKGVKAGDIIKHIAPICGGKGGGKAETAMGGGTNLLKLDDALAAVDDFVAEVMK